MNVRVDIEQNLRLDVLERCEEACNIARYDVLSIDPSLIAKIGLAREWGRIASTGRRLVELHGTLQLAGEAPDKWLARKKRRKYCLKP
jgi:predicted DNA-binding WGR domain protein